MRCVSRLMFGLCALCTIFSAVAETLPIEQLRLPPGFKIEIFNDRVPNARSLAVGSKGTVFVGTLRGGRVYAITSREGKAQQVYLIAQGMFAPNGVAFRDGSLYVAEVSRILRYDDIEAHLSDPPRPVVVTDKLPNDQHHGWKFIRFGPDGYLYVPVGAPCNVCEPDFNRHANIMRMRPDGSGLEVFAKGVRNSVGFDWDPLTRELWFTDNGRDMLGDDLPSCELNHAPRAGMHFGFPYCHQGDVADPKFGARHACGEFEPPALKLGAHVAPLGMRFYNGSMFPETYRNQILVALHGSWNRSSKSGYKVMRVRIENGKVTEYAPFVEGWLQGEENWGRPVDIQQMPDGSVLISDDEAGAIYRVSYRAPR